MIRGFYSAGSGLKAQQTAIDTAANNMANVNTNGYKAQSVSFSELMYSNIEGTAAENAKVGNGAKVSQTAKVLTQGGTQFTGNPLDFALTSDGFFAVETKNGEVCFTRDGRFGISSENTGNYLVTSAGDYVLDRAGNRILADSADLTDQIGVFSFRNPYGLVNKGDNLYESTAASGEAFVLAANIQSGYLESSNVDLATEMSNLIEIQRAYQFNAKIIKTADEIADITNHLR